MQTHPLLRSSDPNSDTNRRRIAHERRKRRRRLLMPWVAVIVSLAALFYAAWVAWQIIMERR